LKRYLTRGHENASITERPMKSWAHVLHFAVECSKPNSRHQKLNPCALSEENLFVTLTQVLNLLQDLTISDFSV
jgi:hypothetical protein